jgi:poly(A) polymerase
MADTDVRETLPVQPWMRSPRTQAVMAALAAAGGADCARFVGGCVRNALSGHPVDDVDIATTLPPERVIAALEAAGLRAAPTGLDHGTVTAVARGQPFEITTLRRDVETDGRRAVVAFTTDWAEDAQRRDFRLNAVYADAQGGLYDPTGEGAADARAGRIVFVGDADTRIAEDALRILRFFRFQAWYGRGEPDPAGLAACARGVDRLAGLSAERVSKELLKLLAAADPRPAVRLMAQAGALAKALPEARDLRRFDRLVEIETGQLFQADAALRLAALLPDDPAAGAAVAERLRLSNAQRARLTAALGSAPRIVSWMSPREARRALYRLGVEAFCDRALLAWAASDRLAAAMQWRALLAMAASWPRPSPPITGAEVKAAGVPEGPLVGAVLREVEDWWIDNDFPDDRLAAVEQLKAVAQGMAY